MFQLGEIRVGDGCEAILAIKGPVAKAVGHDHIDDAVADSDVSCVTEQITNGIFVKMAALDWVFEPVTEAVIA